ncbi:MAG: hypothetical protein WCG52_07080 [bacterium]
MEIYDSLNLNVVGFEFNPTQKRRAMHTISTPRSPNSPSSLTSKNKKTVEKINRRNKEPRGKPRSTSTARDNSRKQDPNQNTQTFLRLKKEGDLSRHELQPLSLSGSLGLWIETAQFWSQPDFFARLKANTPK